MRIYTISIPLARQATSIVGGEKIASDPNFIDTTVMTGNKLIAPTWAMVNDYKSHKITMDDYYGKYLAIISEATSFKNLDKFNKLFDKPYVILGCYCKPRDFCHRFILADILAVYREDNCYAGEITDDTFKWCNGCAFHTETKQSWGIAVSNRTYVCNHRNASDNTRNTMYLGPSSPVKPGCPHKFVTINAFYESRMD